MNTFRSKEERLSSGSYSGYYKRNNNFRFSKFRKIWFCGKKCLDMGCNEGLVTMKIAEEFLPKHILGIDMDKLVIDSAISSIKRAKYSTKSMLETSKEYHPNHTKSFVASSSSEFLFVPRTIAMKKTSEIEQTKINMINPPAIIFPLNVEFSCCDIFTFPKPIIPFDVILCLSMSKWVHLNMGDIGLFKLFETWYNLLHENGKIIFEYQTWKSYCNKKLLTETINKNFKTIKIKPESFEMILQVEFGFFIEERQGSSPAESSGFNRPILILTKQSTRRSAFSEADLEAILSRYNHEEKTVVLLEEAPNEEDKKKKKKKKKHKHSTEVDPSVSSKKARRAAPATDGGPGEDAHGTENEN